MMQKMIPFIPMEILSSGDDGIHADSNVTIAGGTIDITKSYEGIEGLSIDVTGGESSVLASDDGMNAAGGNDSSGFEGPGPGGDQFASTEGAYIHISGGILHVNSSGDGIDSNGEITVSGGETYVSGPTNDGNGTLDYSGTAQITGGIFAASGSSGMAQNFDSSSTQGVIMVNVEEQETNTEIALLDISGTKLLGWTAEKEYSSVIVSSPEIQQGETYTLKTGTAEQNITMDSLVYGNPSQGGVPGRFQDFLKIRSLVPVRFLTLPVFAADFQNILRLLRKTFMLMYLVSMETAPLFRGQVLIFPVSVWMNIIS